MFNISLFNKKNFLQFLRFGTVGFINTAIDFGILNFLRWVFGVAFGWPVIVFNVISVGVAMINSYFLNKHWVFKKWETESRFAESFLFVFFTGLGMVLNTGIVYYFSTYFEPIFNIDPVLWLNIGKVMATAVSLLWNFFWYKFVVFRKSHE